MMTLQKNINIFNQLSKIDKKVLNLLYHGYTRKETAEIIHSVKPLVDKRIKFFYSKFNVTSELGLRIIVKEIETVKNEEK